jgi:hypothetical protein
LYPWKEVETRSTFGSAVEVWPWSKDQSGLGCVAWPPSRASYWVSEALWIVRLIPAFSHSD